MNKPLLIILLLFIPSLVICQEQEDHWEAYLSQYDDDAGSVLVNFSLKGKAPVATYPYVVVTGVTFAGCEGGFPTKEEFNRLYVIADSVEAIIKSISPNTKAGTFTHKCERLDYYYVSDTQQLRSALEALYKRRFGNYKPYINIKEDKKWEYYLSFLYPNEATLNYMGDQKVVLSLKNAGDKLEKPRQVDHWIYFETKKDRDKFLEYIKSEKFKIEEHT